MNSSSNRNSSLTVEDIVSSIEVLRMQEDTTYRREDYLYQEQVDLPNGPLPTPSMVDAQCRSKMAHWYYQILDFVQLNRETASIAMNYLDRYLITESGRSALTSRKRYQNIAMTCLYTAVKIHEREAIDLKLMSALSRGLYSEEEIAETERDVLNALKWRVNPPTVMAFVRYFLSLVPSSIMSEETFMVAFELAQFHSELALFEYDLVGIPDSSVAFACVAIALKYVFGDNKHTSQCLRVVANAASVDVYAAADVQPMLRNSGIMENCVETLVPAFNTSLVKSVGNGCRSVHVSPRSIANQS